MEVVALHQRQRQARRQLGARPPTCRSRPRPSRRRAAARAAGGRRACRRLWWPPRRRVRVQPWRRARARVHASRARPRTRSQRQPCDAAGQLASGAARPGPRPARRSASGCSTPARFSAPRATATGANTGSQREVGGAAGVPGLDHHALAGPQVHRAADFQHVVAGVARVCCRAGRRPWPRPGHGPRAGCRRWRGRSVIARPRASFHVPGRAVAGADWSSWAADAGGHGDLLGDGISEWMIVHARLAVQ